MVRLTRRGLSSKQNTNLAYLNLTYAIPHIPYFCIFSLTMSFWIQHHRKWKNMNQKKSQITENLRGLLVYFSFHLVCSLWKNIMMWVQQIYSFFLWFIICIISYPLSNREFEIKVNSLNNKTHSHPKSPRQYKMRWLERHRTVCWGSTSSHFERSSKISGLALMSNNIFSNDFHHMQRCWFCNLINL